MKVKATRGFSLGGGRDVDPGEVFETDEWNARRLVGLGLATPAGADPAPHPEAGRGADALVAREPEPEDREPQKARGKKE